MELRSTTGHLLWFDASGELDAATKLSSAFSGVSIDARSTYSDVLLDMKLDPCGARTKRIVLE